MSTYKLYYFNARGGAESSRIIFAQADVKYEDIRFEDEQWPKEYKEKMPFGRVPVLEVDGTMMAGSINILRYLGTKFGMAGKDEIANAVLGGASDYMCDIFAKVIQWYYTKDDQKDQVVQEFKEKTGPSMLGTLQKQVKNGHINGSETLSWADVQCFTLLEDLKKYFGINIVDYPELEKVHENVATQPNIKKWLETRPKTEN